MRPDEIIKRLKDLGHFDNPESTQGVTYEDLPKLKLHDKVVKDAIKSFQEFMKSDLDGFTQHYHGREAIADGDIGDATNDLFEFPRCGCPDYKIHDAPEGALGASGPLEANWPTACRGNIKFGRNFKSLPGSNEADTHGVWWGVANIWTTAIEDVEVFAADVNDSAVQVYAQLLALTGSTLAWSYLAQNNCNARLQQSYNTRTNWASQQFAVTVASHEFCHALGAPHVKDSKALMYPSIHQHSQARYGFPNQTDLNQMKQLGYKLSGKTELSRDKLFIPRDQWGDNPNQPPTPDIPNDSEYYVTGVQQVRRRSDDKVVYEFISVPYKKV